MVNPNMNIKNVRKISWWAREDKAVLIRSQETEQVNKPYESPFTCLEISTTGSRIKVKESHRIVWHNSKNFFAFKRKRWDGHDVMEIT